MATITPKQAKQRIAQRQSKIERLKNLLTSASSPAQKAKLKADLAAAKDGLAQLKAAAKAR